MKTHHSFMVQLAGAAAPSFDKKCVQDEVRDGRDEWNTVCVAAPVGCRCDGSEQDRDVVRANMATVRQASTSHSRLRVRRSTSPRLTCSTGP